MEYISCSRMILLDRAQKKAEIVGEKVLLSVTLGEPKQLNGRFLYEIGHYIFHALPM